MKPLKPVKAVADRRQRRRQAQDEPRQIDSPYLTVAEAVQYLRLNTRQALYNHIARNRLPTLRRGGRYLFDRRELDLWLRGTTALELRHPKSRLVGA